MAYDEGLAERIRTALEEERDVVEKRMFGGLCSMVAGKMCVGIVKDELMVRVGSEGDAMALAQPYARPMDFTGKPMKGFVFVASDGFESDARLSWWVEQGTRFAKAAAGAPKVKKARASRKARAKR